MPCSRIECRGQVYSVNDHLMEEIITLGARSLPEFRNTRNESTSVAWLKQALEEWQPQLEMAPGCKLLWLDEFLISDKEVKVFTEFLKFLADVVRKTYPPDGRIINGDAFETVALFVESAVKAKMADGSEQATVYWRPKAGEP